MASRVGRRKGKQVRRRNLPFSIENVLELLEEDYGRSRFIARFDPVEELISCILSQHTADANSFPTFTRLREEFPDWGDVIVAGVDRVAVVIKKAGLARQKAKSVVGSLEAIRAESGDFKLDFLREMSDEEARQWLLALPGVGPKTAAIVLCFALGRHAIPVDTHVHRVSLRLGVLAEGTDANRAHLVLDKTVPESLAFRYHTILIQHGRMTCTARSPSCESCRLSEMCRWYQKNGGVA